MLYRELLREEAARVLRAAGTLAGPNVFTARSWPIAAPALPMIQLQVLADTAESAGRSVPQFTRTAGLLITAKVEFGTPAEGEILLDTLCEQIEMALMLDVALQTMLQQVAVIQTELAFDSTSSQQIAVARMRFDLEFTQVFAPSGPPLTEIMMQIANQAGVTLATATVDLPPA